MSKYFRATNDNGQTIIDDETSRLALLSKEYVYNMGIGNVETILFAAYDSGRWTGGKNAPDANLQVDYILTYKFQAHSNELLFAIKPLVKDEYIGYLVERVSSTVGEYNTKIWVIMGKSRTHFTGTSTEEYLKVAKNIEVYTFVNTKDAGMVTMSYKDSSDNITSKTVSSSLVRGSVGLRIKNENSEYVFSSNLKYANIVGTFSYSLDFSNYKDGGLGYPFAAFPKAIFTGISNEHAISCNSYAGSSVYIAVRGITAYPSAYAYTYGESGIFARWFIFGDYFATYSGNTTDSISWYSNLSYTCCFPSSKHMNIIAVSTNNLFY